MRSAEYEIVVGTRDIGRGHVENVAYPAYVVTVRDRLLRAAIGPAYDEQLKPDVHLEVDIHAELVAGDRVRAVVTVAEVGSSSITTTVELFHDGALVAEGETVQVLTDAETGEAVSVPDDWRDALEA